MEMILHDSETPSEFRGKWRDEWSDTLRAATVVYAHSPGVRYVKIPGCVFDSPSPLCQCGGCSEARRIRSRVKWLAERNNETVAEIDWCGSQFARIAPRNTTGASIHE